jgi:hypothetical protein
VLKVLETQIMAVKIPPEGLTKPGAELFQLLGACDLTRATADMFIKTLQAAVDLLTADDVDNNRRSGAKASSAGRARARALACLLSGPLAAAFAVALCGRRPSTSAARPSLSWLPSPPSSHSFPLKPSNPQTS